MGWEKNVGLSSFNKYQRWRLKWVLFLRERNWWAQWAIVQKKKFSNGTRKENVGDSNYKPIPIEDKNKYVSTSICYWMRDMGMKMA